MGSTSVVPPGPAGEGAGAARARGIGEAVGPAAQQSLDEALRLAVGARRVGPRAQVAEPELLAALPPGARAVGGAVVGHHLLHHEPLRAVPAQRPLEQGERVGPAVARQHLHVSEAGVVVDGDVHVLPARARAALHAVAQDARAHVPEAAELLGVDGQERSRSRALVAHHTWARGLRQARAAKTPQHLANRGRGAVDDRAHHLRTAAAAFAHGADLSFGLARESTRLAVGRAGSTAQARPARGAIAHPPAVAAAATGAVSPGRLLRRGAVEHRLHHPTARLVREAHASRRQRRIRHLGLLRNLELLQPQVSSEARKRSAVSKVCSQYN